MSKETITRCEKQKPRFHAFLKVSVCETKSLCRTWRPLLSKLVNAVGGKMWNFGSLEE